MRKRKKQPITKHQKRWDTAFRRMHQQRDDVLDLEAFEKRVKERSRPLEKVLQSSRAHPGNSKEAARKDQPGKFYEDITNARFWRLIERRRKQSTITMDDMRRRVGTGRAQDSKRR